MERSIEIKKFINDHQELFWYSPGNKSETVSDESLVETILNYGDMSTINMFFRIFGLRNASKIFFESINKSKRRQNNYSEPTINYFTLLFNRYAQ